MSNGIRRFLAWAGVMLVAVCRVCAADPGDTWLTETHGSGVPPDGVVWLAPGSQCRVAQDKLPQAVGALGSNAFVALTAAGLASYVGAACKGKYGQIPYLVRAVSTAGEGHLDAGLFHGDLWVRFAGLGGRDPFEKTPVVLWLYAPPALVHVSASIVE